VPFAQAQVESFEFVEAAAQTRVRWTLALEPRLLTRFGAPLAGRMISRLLRHAMENLAAYLERNGASVR
jgi:hypothetical protein